MVEALKRRGRLSGGRSISEQVAALVGLMEQGLLFVATDRGWLRVDRGGEDVYSRLGSPFRKGGVNVEGDYGAAE